MSQYYKHWVLSSLGIIHALFFVVFIIMSVPIVGGGLVLAGASIVQMVVACLVVLVIGITPLAVIYFQQKGKIRLGYVFGLYLAFEVWLLSTVVLKMIKDIYFAYQYGFGSISGFGFEFYSFLLAIFFLIFALHLYIFGKTLSQDIK